MVRIVRLVRLIRIVKIYKTIQNEQDEPDEDEEYDAITGEKLQKKNMNMDKAAQERKRQEKITKTITKLEEEVIIDDELDVFYFFCINFQDPTRNQCW